MCSAPQFERTQAHRGPCTWHSCWYEPGCPPQVLVPTSVYCTAQPAPARERSLLVDGWVVGGWAVGWVVGGCWVAVAAQALRRARVGLWRVQTMGGRSWGQQTERLTRPKRRPLACM